MPINITTEERAFSSAADWRQRRPDLAGRGVVVVNRAGKACGWMDALRNPEHWEPGCRAVDVEGRQWLATGGEDYNGAREWTQTKTDHMLGALICF